MAISARTLYGTGATFAAGVVATLAVVNFSGGEHAVSSQVVQSATQPNPRDVEKPAWSDPVRSHSSPTASAPHESRPPMTFTPGDSGHHGGRGRSQAAGAERQEETPPSVSQANGSEGRAASRTETAQLRPIKQHSALSSGRGPWAQNALSEKPRDKPVIVPQAAREQPEITNGAAPANPRSPVTTEQTEARTRRFVTSGRDTHRQEAKLPLKTTSDGQSLAAIKEARRIVPLRVTKPTDAQLAEGATPSPWGRRRPQNNAAEPKRHYSAADTSGVMGWLMKPAERF
ncbi:hypothetical protein FHU13_001516 [Methylobacterium sp. R2-1]|nr:hypothetical protein [Methylobacterium sp. R2-1]